MSIVPTPSPQPHDPANPPPPAGAEEFALKVGLFWEKNRSAILLLIAIVFVALVGREGWQWFQASRERDIEETYAKIGDRLEQLPKFANEHAGHSLAGVAWLRLGDDAYTKNDFKSAAAHYAKAADALENVALKSRARLGAGIAQLAGGDRTAAETSLKALSGDAKAVKPVRAEAAYNLAVLAHEAGKDDDAKKFIEQITQIDAMSLWAQRGFALRAQIDAAKPATPAAPAAGAPTIEFKPKG